MNTERPSRIGAKKTYAQLEQENRELKLELRQLRRENKRIMVENMSLKKGIGSCSKANEALKGNGRTTEITDRMDTTYTQNYTEKGRDTFDAHDVAIDKDLLNDSNTFTSPVNKRNLS